MATPHLAGLAAVLWSAKPAATVVEIEQAILNSCALGSLPPGRAGRGIPNAPRAFELLTGAALPAGAARGGRRASKVREKGKRPAPKRPARKPKPAARGRKP
jgi:subtilisin family serine protease